MTRYSIRASDAVTAVSQFLRQAAIETFPETAEVVLIPNFVDLGAYSRITNGEQRLKLAAEEEVLLVHLSNFRAVKRPVDTVRILAAVNEQRPARLLLIGEGPEMAAVRAEGDRLNVQDRIRALGNQVHVQPLLACGDVFLLPSQEESFGLAALEALACGVPAVTSDVGGLKEVIENGKSGFRTAVGDTESMAARVLEMVGDRATLEAYREEACNRAKRFDAERIVPMYEELYRRTLS
jgi:N-acetyl-alpha-D-glucosaminyl L-malate synthase BshA